MSKFSTGTAGILALGLIAAPMACIVTGCSSTSAAAATVNGEAIEEQTITDYIQNYRETHGCASDEAWAQYLVDQGLTPENLRQNTIDYYVQDKVIEQDAKSKGLSVDDKEVDEQLQEIKDYYGYSDEQFEEQIGKLGFTKDAYRDYVRLSLLKDKLKNEVDESADPEDSAVLESAASFATLLNGSKEYKYIAFDRSDKETAEKVAKELADGGDFDALAKEYSVVEDGELDGWDVLITPDTAVSTAMAEAKKGDVSDVIEGTNYLLIAKVNDICVVGEKGFDSVDQIPTAIKDQIVETLKANTAAQYFSEYIQKLVEEADIEIMDMPENLPYAVSLEGVEPTNSSSSNTVSLDGSDATITVDEEGNVTDAAAEGADK